MSNPLHKRLSSSERLKADSKAKQYAYTVQSVAIPFFVFPRNQMLILLKR